MINEIEIRPLLASAIATLDGATSCAEILDATDQARLAYDRAKSLARTISAHDGMIAACHRIQADALEIEARAKRRLANEYDAAVVRGEVHGHGGQGKRDIPDENIPAPVADLGVTSKQIHEARKVRDAEEVEPGVVVNTINAALDAGKEPTHADVTRAVDAVLARSAVPKHMRPSRVRDEGFDRAMNERYLPKSNTPIIAYTVKARADWQTAALANPPTNAEEAKMRYYAVAFECEEVKKAIEAPLIKAQGQVLKGAKRFFATDRDWRAWIKSLKVCEYSTFCVDSALQAVGITPKGQRTDTTGWLTSRLAAAMREDTWPEFRAEIEALFDKYQPEAPLAAAGEASGRA